MKFSPMRTYTYKMKSIQTIFSLIVSVLLTCGCGQELPFEDPQKGNGKESICISLKTSNEGETKAGTAKDGDVMNTLHIWIADGVGNIVYKGYYDGTSVSGEKFTFALADDKKTATATFENVERGDYMMYVVANLPESFSDFAAKTSADAEFTDAVLPSLNAANRPPFDDEHGMPLSMRQMIHVGPGVNTIETQLVRVCGRIRVTVRNMTTDKNIFLQSFKLTDKNPSTGYLFHKDDHGIPAGTTFGKFDSFELTGTMATRYIAPGDEDTYIDQYLYETGLTGMGTLGFEIIGGIYEKSVTNAEVEDIPSIEAGSKTTTYQAGTDYLIENASGNICLNDNGNGLQATPYTNLNVLLLTNALDSYLWNFSSNGPTGTDQRVSLCNAGTRRYLSLTGDPSYTFDMSDVETNIRAFVRPGADGLELSPSSTPWYVLYYTELKLKVKYYSTSNENYWKLIPVTKTGSAGKQLKDALKVFNRVNSSISYIDQYGLPVTLEHICRNDDVNVIINVFYSPESGVLYFRVEDWTDVSNYTTFD